MKLTVDAQALREAAGRAVTSRQLANTEHMLLHAADGQLIVTSTDLVVALTERLAATVQTEGAATCSPSLLRAALNGLDGVVEVSISGFTLTVRQGRRRYVLESFDPSVFPGAQEAANVREIAIDAKKFGQAMARVVYCAPTDDSRIYLNGVSVNGERVAGTDGHRVAIAPIKSEMPAIIIPTGSARQALGMWNEAMRCRVIEAAAGNPSEIEFYDDARSLRARLLDGRYPDLAPALNQAKTIARVTFDPREAVDALTRMLPFCERRNDKVSWHEITVTVTGDSLALAAADHETRDYVTCTNEGATPEVTLAPSYLRDALQKAEGARVEWLVADDEAPQRLNFEGRDDAHYIVPMRRR